MLPTWTGKFDSAYSSQLKDYYIVNRVRPEFEEAPYADRISYYNATIKVKFWNEAKVYAILLVEEGVTP